MIRIGAVQGYIELMQSLNADPFLLLEKNGIAVEQISDVDGFIKISKVINLLEQSAQLTQCFDFGLRLTNFQPQEMLGLYLLLLKSNASIEQILSDASRYLFLHSPSMKLFLDRKQKHFQNSASLLFDIQLDEYIEQRQMIDGCLGRLYVVSTEIFHIPIQHIKAVSLPHSPIAPVSAYQRFFKVPVYFEQPFAAIHFDEALLNNQLLVENSFLRNALIFQIATQFPPLRSESLVERVQFLCRASIGLKPLKKGEMSSILNMHPRTLQRRLAEENTDFETIKDQVYRQVTLAYLWDTTLPIQQISNILGFSEAAVLTRACYRWFDQSPKAIRSSRKI